MDPRIACNINYARIRIARAEKQDALGARRHAVVSRARRICARTYIARAEKRGGGKIRLVYLDRFLCALPECWQYQSDCSIE